MTYAIEEGESVGRAIPRIVLGRIDLAAGQLSDEQSSPEERVHDARKRFKEVRAALRLIREPLGAHFSSQNGWFRDRGHELASLRDADAVIEALDALQEFADGFQERRVVRSVRRRLNHARRKSRRQDSGRIIGDVLAQLPIAKAGVTLWPALADDFSMIAPGLQRTYKDGRRAFDAAHEKPVEDRLHDWRKRVKDHWYHAQILRHADASFMKPYREQLEQLSSALGDRHDLDVLRARVLASLGTRDGRTFSALLDRRSEELTARALVLGDSIYADGAKSRIEQIRTAWAASHPPAEGVSETGPQPDVGLRTGDSALIQ